VPSLATGPRDRWWQHRRPLASRSLRMYSKRHHSASEAVFSLPPGNTANVRLANTHDVLDLAVCMSLALAHLGFRATQGFGSNLPSNSRTPPCRMSRPRTGESGSASGSGAGITIRPGSNTEVKESMLRLFYSSHSAL
jgi:hypothetical protein